MLVNILRKPAPTGLTVEAKLKFNRLKWNHVHDKHEHKYYLIYAYANLTDLNADTNGVIIERVYENRFKDDRGSLVKDQFCGYRVSAVDIYENESFKTGPVNVLFKHVGDTDVDHTSPGLPTGLTVGPASIERTVDGQIISNSIASWTAPVGGIPVKYYLIKVTQVSNGEHEVYKTDTLSQVFRVKPGLAYQVQVKSVNLFNDPSAYTTAVSYTRAKKTGDMPAVGTVNYVASKKRIKLDWADVNDDTYPDYRITYIYRNTVNTAPTLGTTTPYKKTKAGYFIDDGVTTGTNYYYWIVHKDNSGNYGTLSTVLGPLQSGGNEVGSFTDLTGSIAEAQIPNDGVGEGKLKRNDPSNLVRGSDLLDTSLFAGTPGTLSSLATGSAFSSQNYLLLTATTAQSDIYSGRGGVAEIPLRRSKKYYVSAYIGTVSGTAVDCELYLQLFSMDAAGVQTLVSSPLVGTYSGTSYARVEKIIDIPANVRRGRLIARKLISGVAATNILIEPDVHIATDEEMLADGSVKAAKTDPTAPGTPTGLSIGPGALERLDDGTIVVHSAVSWVAPVGGVVFTTYRIKVTQVSNSEVQFYDVPVGTLARAIPVKTGKSYNYQVCAVTFNNKEGVYTTAVAYTRPKKTGDMPAVGTVNYVASKKRIKLDWIDVDDDTYPDYRTTYIYRNTVNTVPTLGTTTPYKKTKAGYFIDDGVTTGQTYYYWAVHKDNSGNFGAISTTLGPITSNGNEVGSFTDLTGVVTGSQLGAGRGTNLLINTNANLSSAYWAEGADPNNVGDFFIGAVNYAWAPKGERVFAIQQTNGTTGSYTDVHQVDETGASRKIPVKANQRYEFHLLTGSHRCTSRAYIMWYDSTDFNLSNVFTDDNAGTHAGGLLLSGYKQIGQFAIAPPTAAYARIQVRKLNTNVGGANSYLFFTHLFFGEAGANQTEYSPWAENGNLIATADVTDQRVPTAPLSLSAGVGSLEIDDDGRKTAFTALTWAAPATNATLVTVYRIKVTQVSTGEVRWFESKNLSASIEVKTGKSYNYEVCAVTFNNKEGAYTTAVAYTRPKKAGSLPAVGTVVLTPGKKRINVSWPAVNDDTYPDYRMSYIYRNTVNTAPTLGTTTPYRKTKGDSVLDEGVTTAQTYYYWVAHKDDAGYFSALSTVQSGTSLGNEVSGFTDLTGSIAGGQIPNDTITNPMVAPDAIGSTELASSAVLPENFRRNPAGNLITDRDMVNPSMWYFRDWIDDDSADNGEAAGSTPLPALNWERRVNPGDDLFGASDYKFWLKATAANKCLSIESDRLSPVEYHQRYKLTAKFKMLNMGAGSLRPRYVYLGGVQWKQDAGGALVKSNIFTVGQIIGSTLVNGAINTIVGDFFSNQEDVSYISLQLLTVTQFGSSGDTYIHEMEVSSVSILPVPSARDFSVVVESTSGSGTISFGAAVNGVYINSEFIDMTVKHQLRRVRKWIVGAQFVNKSGAAKVFTLRVDLRKHSDDSLVGTIYTSPSFNVRDDEMHTINMAIGESEAGISTLDPILYYIELRLIGAATGNVINGGRVWCDMRFGDDVL